MNLPLEVVLDDLEACNAFYDFCARYHAEENVRFYMACEVFRNRDWKAVKLLGITNSEEDDQRMVEEVRKAKERAKVGARKSIRMSKRNLFRRGSKVDRLQDEEHKLNRLQTIFPES